MTAQKLSKLSAFLLATQLLAQQVTPPSNAGRNTNHIASGWQPGSTITVLIDTQLGLPGSGSYNAYAQGFMNDQSGYSQYGITYQFQSYDRSQGEPTLTTNQAYLYSGMPPAGDAAYNSWTYQESYVYNYNLTTTSSIVVDPSFTDPTFQSTVIGHENAHNLLLDDCSQCAQGSSQMAVPLYESNPVEYPQSVDTQSSYQYSYSPNPE